MEDRKNQSLICLGLYLSQQRYIVVTYLKKKDEDWRYTHRNKSRKAQVISQKLFVSSSPWFFFLWPSFETENHMSRRWIREGEELWVLKFQKRRLIESYAGRYEIAMMLVRVMRDNDWATNRESLDSEILVW